LDQISAPPGQVPTEPGFQSVILCTPFGSDPVSSFCGIFGPNPGNPHAGYLVGQNPTADQSFSPNQADREDLWSDAHQAGPQGATLRIGDVPPGEYRVVVLAHNAAGVPTEATCVSINGQPDGCVQNSPKAPLEVGVSQSLIVDLVGARAVEDGVIDIFFEQDPGNGVGGWVSGVLVFVPEPSTAVLLAIGLVGAIAFRLRWPRRGA
jgi:hypothetical protein